MKHTNKANLFIVGAMKAGTTSFNTALANHPNIYFSPIKEPNYFVNALPKAIYNPSKFFSIDDYFEKEFPKQLHIANIQNRALYDKLFSLATERHIYLAEGSTTYLHAQESPDKIYSFNPEAKIIILIRNGLKRAFSHYRMDVGLGRTTLSFEDELRKDWEAYQKGTLSNWSYLGMSLYAGNILRYKHFFKGNVLVLSFEDLISKEEEIFRKVSSFLGLDYIPVNLSHTNESSNIRFSKGLSWLYKTGLKDVLSYILPVKVRHIAFDLLKRKSSSTINLSPEFNEELLHLFQADVIKIKQGC